MGGIDGVELGGPPPRRIPFDLRLRTISAARASFARILREWARGSMDDVTFKIVVYGMAGLLAFLKTESDECIENRLVALETRLKGGTL